MTTVFLLCSLVIVLAVRGASAQQVTVETKKKLIPAGPGQKPFDVTRHTIPIDEIRTGVPGRDAIPALAAPNFLAADRVRGLLRESDRVLGVFLNGDAKAYPIRILNYHELVNDSVGGRPVLVTW
jgi:hypothetical protein